MKRLGILFALVWLALSPSFALTFKHEPIPQWIQDLMLETRVYTHKNPVKIERLRLLTVTYLNFDDEVKQGNLIVMDAVADRAVEVFKELYQRKFPMVLLDTAARVEKNTKLAKKSFWQRNWESVLENLYALVGKQLKVKETTEYTSLTTSFYGRKIRGKNKWSMHAYGVAIDVNSLQNPFVVFDGEGNASYVPKDGWQYANRKLHRPGKEYRPGMVEEILDVFYKHGFSVWGGHWDSPIDYMHFQTPRWLAEQMAKLDPAAAKRKFEEHIKNLPPLEIAERAGVESTGNRKID